MADPWEKYSGAEIYKTFFAEEVDMRDLYKAMSDQWETGQLLPIKTNRLTGDHDWAVPRVLSAIIDGIMAPGRALQGEYRYVDLETGLPLRLDESGRYTSIEEDAANAALAVSPSAVIRGITTRTAAKTSTTPASRSGWEKPQLFTNLAPDDHPLPVNAVPNNLLRSISQRVLYVVKQDGTLVVVKRKRHGSGHVDLAGGEAVIAAGEALIVNGRVLMLNNRSGHYKPSGVTAQKAAEEAFKREGLEVGDNIYRDIGHP